MERMRGWYERSLWWRAVRKLAEERAEFWTEINSAINESNILESYMKKDAKESLRDC